MKTAWLERLRRQCPELDVQEQESMARHTSFRIGGPALAMAFPKSEHALSEVLRFAKNESISPLILGAGTNVLARDEGVDGLVICLRDGLTELTLLEGHRVLAGAGVSMAHAAVFACEEGLSGLEFAHGIPGTVGGGVFMNAGAYGGEIRQVAVETTAMDADGALHTYCGEEQGFGYRTSAFQSLGQIIVRTVFQLTPGNPVEIRAKMQELASRRRASQPLNYPSAGSTFKRPAGGYAAALIEQAGLKGLRVGGVSVSEKHAGFLINDQGGTCADVLELIRTVQERVYAHSGIQLEPEVRLI